MARGEQGPRTAEHVETVTEGRCWTYYRHRPTDLAGDGSYYVLVFFLFFLILLLFQDRCKRSVRSNGNKDKLKFLKIKFS